MTDTLPIQVNLVGDIVASSGIVAVDSGTITWHGEVNAATGVTITYVVRMADTMDAGEVVTNTVQFDDGVGNVLAHNATVIVAGHALHLPFLRR